MARGTLLVRADIKFEALVELGWGVLYFVENHDVVG